MATAKISKLANPAHRLAALVFTDIIGSTQLKSRLRNEYLQLLERHNELFEAGIREIEGAEIVKHTGDGYFAAFPTASEAVRFALVFQSRMLLEPWSPEVIKTRLGIHIGEVVFMDMAGRPDIVGLSADIAARLMSLAIGGQILLTDTAFNDARQYVDRSPDILKDAPCLRWVAHGRYLFKGADDPLEVYEVGIEKLSPLVPPGDSDKVKRVVPHDQEATLGWRPAAALPVPGRPGWDLVRKLGEGAFGEVWLGEHQKLKELRVFKFCFDVERLRSLKREYALFRLLQGALGRRADIATLYEVKLDEPPYFLESEYSEGGDLLEWSEHDGRLKAMSLAQRLEILAKVADAVAAAHSVGVLHKDIKPSNILVHEVANGQLQLLLADFGIGVLSDRSKLKAHNVTEANFTEADTAESAKSFGTRMYAPPESMQDRPFTTGGDIYALGVLLYQLVVADLRRPLATGWERDINDELLAKDIAEISEGDPTRRTGSADEVARRIRSLETRRAELLKARASAVAEEKRKRLRHLVMVGGGGLVCFLVLMSIIGATYTCKLRVAHARTLAEHQRTLMEQAKTLAEQGKTKAATDFLLDVIKKADPANSTNGNPSARELITEAAGQMDAAFAEDSDLNAQLQMSFAEALRNFGDPRAVDHYAKAGDIYLKLHGAEDPRTLLAQYGQGYALILVPNYLEAKRILANVLEKQTRLLGPDNRDTLGTALIYAAAVNYVDGPKKAQPLFEDALSRREKAFGLNDRDTIQSISGYSLVERDLGDLDKAAELAKQALDWRQANLGPTHFGTLPSLMMYGSILVELGRAPEAEPLLKTVVERRLKIGGEEIGKETNTNTLRAFAEYADALNAMGRYSDAEPFYTMAIGGMLAQPGGDQNNHAMLALCGYAALLNATHRSDIAEPKARQAMETLSKVRGPKERETLRATYVLASVLDSLGKPEARTEYAAAAAGALDSFGPTSPLTIRYQKANADYLARTSGK